ncbi:MAG TPA: hypothetical protein VIF57_01265 [Polyangia bacterium]
MRGKKTRPLVWILRGGLATLGLAGAVYAADQTTAPPANDVAQTITNQKIREGTPVKAAQQDPEHQIETLSPDQMIDLAAKYDGEEKAALEHAENSRIIAYRSRDIIRMTCIEDKLTQMKDVTIGAGARLLGLPRLKENDLVMRQHFLVLQQARNRVLELSAEVDGCMGDVLDATMGRLKEEAPTTDPITDPTRPPAPTRDIQRPGEASPYR